MKFDVNEEGWPNPDLAIHSSYEGALIDGLHSDKVKAGDEREIQQMKDLQLYSWVKETDIPPNKSILLTSWARQVKGNEVRSPCVLKDFATTVRDDVFAPNQSPLPMRGLLLHATWFDLRVETGMLADSSCEMLARPPKGQERDGWIWRLHGAMNGMRTASRDFTEFLAGTLTEHMGFKRGKLERCLFVHESNEKRVVSHVDDLSSVLSQQRLKISGCRSRSWPWSREEKLSTTAFLWFTWDSSTEVYTMAIAEDSQ